MVIISVSEDGKKWNPKYKLVYYENIIEIKNLNQIKIFIKKDKEFDFKLCSLNLNKFYFVYGEEFNKVFNIVSFGLTKRRPGSRLY